MKTRSTIHRNIVGAFLGGVFGILGCFFFGTIALAIGCAVGVFGGWFYQELLALMVSGYKQCHDLAFYLRYPLSKQTGIPFTRTISRRVWVAGISLAVASAVSSRYLGFAATIIAILITTAIIGTLYRLWSSIGSAVWAVFSSWFKEHPVNQAVTFRFVAGLVYFILSVRYLYTPMYAKAVNISVSHPNTFLGAILPTITMVFLGVFLLFSIALKVEMFDNSYTMSGFYRTWERYARNRALFFVHDLAEFFLAELVLVIWAGLAIIWWLGLGSLFTLLILGPICIVVDGLKAYYRVANKGAHWICFGCTLSTTGAIYWLTQSHMHDARVILLIALSAGTLSAFVAHAVLQLSMKFITRSKVLIQVLNTPIKNYLLPPSQKFWGVTSVIQGWMFKMTPNRP